MQPPSDASSATLGSDSYLFDVERTIEHPKADEPHDCPLFDGNEQAPSLLGVGKPIYLRRRPISHQRHVHLTEQVARGDLHQRQGRDLGAGCQTHGHPLLHTANVSAGRCGFAYASSASRRREGPPEACSSV